MYIIDRVYTSLGKRHSLISLVDPKAEGFEQISQMVHIMIAEDTDYHRSRNGYMSYDSTVL